MQALYMGPFYTRCVTRSIPVVPCLASQDRGQVPIPLGGTRQEYYKEYVSLSVSTFLALCCATEQREARAHTTMSTS